MKSILGRGGMMGGGGGSPSPSIMPDNLRSNDTVEILLGLGEGRWKGLKDGRKSFFVGETPLEDVAGNPNFDTISLNIGRGSGDETVLFQLAGASISHNVGVNLAKDVPVIRQGTSTAAVVDVETLPAEGEFIGEVYQVDGEEFWVWSEDGWRQTNDQYVNKLSCRFVISAMYTQTENGTHGFQFHFNLEYKRSDQSDAAYVDAFEHDIVMTGKTTSMTVKQVTWAVPPSDVPYVIRVTMRNASETVGSTQRVIQAAWESFQEVKGQSLVIPGVAHAHLVGRSSNQLGSLPELYGIYECKDDIKVPTNYDPVARTYTGLWDGTFKLAYTTNPAWILYDYVTNDVYGLSAYHPVSLDKYDVYDAAVWCDQMVSDGKGGQQPRWTFNHVIGEPQSGTDLARYIAGTFNATFFDDDNGNAYLRVDKDDPAVALFTPENIVGGLFEYSFTDITTRFNTYTLAFTNKDLNYGQDRRTAVDPAHVAKYGEITDSKIAVGCKDAQECLRRAHYKMLTATTECMAITFKTNRMGSYVQPFDVILCADPKLGFGISGRIKTLNGGRTVATLRDPIYLEAGVAYKATFQVVNTNYPELESNPYVLVERNLTGVTTGSTTSITFASALPSNIPDLANFSLGSTADGLPKPYRVMLRDEDPNGVVTIQAMELNRNKWTDVDNLTLNGMPIYTSLSVTSAPRPQNVTIDVRQRRIAGGFYDVDLVVDWDHIPLSTYSVDISFNDGPFIRYLTDMADSRFEFPSADLGTYRFAISSKRLGGNSSYPVIASVDLETSDYVNPDGVSEVDNFRGMWTGQALRMEWDVPDRPAYFDHFLLQILDPADNEVLREVVIYEEFYDYSVDRNIEDFEAPSRSVKARLKVVLENGTASAIVTDTFTNSAPPTPSSVVQTWTEGGLQISFTPPSDSDFIGTKVWIYTTAGSWNSNQTPTHSKAGNPIVIEGLTRSAVRYMRLAHYDAFGVAGINHSAEITINGEVPAQITGLTFNGTRRRVGARSAITTFALAWTPSPIADHYVLAFRTGPSEDFVEQIVPANSYRQTLYFDLYSNVYAAKVKAVTASGVSGPYSAIVTASMVDDTSPPADPTGLTASGTYNMIIAEWENPSDDDFERVEVYVAATNVRPGSPTATTDKRSYFLTDLPDGAVRYIWLRAYDSSGNYGNYIGPVSATALAVPDADTVPGPPGQVSGLGLTPVVVTNNDGTIDVRLRATWTARTEADLAHYDLHIKETAGGNYVRATTSGTFYEWVVKPNTAYYVKVRAVDAANQAGVFSNEINLTTPGDTTAPGAPTGLSVSGSFNTHFLNWTNPADRDLREIEVFVHTSDVRSSATLLGRVNGTVFINSGVPTGSTRFYWIRAVDTSGNIGAFNATAGVSVSSPTLTAAAFPSDLRPIEIVTSLPSSGNFEGRSVHLTTNGKLYRFVSGAWTAALPATDITGTITGTQIGANTIQTGNLAANSVTAGIIAANAIQASHLSANSVTSDKITAGAITAGAIAANAIQANHLSIVPGNMVADPDFRTTYWTISGSWVRQDRASGNATDILGVARSAVLQGASLGTGYHIIQTGLIRHSSPGQVMRLMAKGYSVPGTNQSLHMDILYYNAASGLIGNGGVLTWTPSETATKELQTTVPADTAFFQIRSYNGANGVTNLSGAMMISNIQLDIAATAALIVDGSITTNKMTANSIVGDRIQVGTLDANRLAASTVLANTITVNGQAIGTVQSNAANPAAVINAGSTTIDPGKILVSGSTTLSNWRNGGDNTKIEGGSIAANTIQANSLKIGARGISFIDLDFSVVPGTNTANWSFGYVFYTDDAGNPQALAISAGTTGPIILWTYIYWIKGEGFLRYTNDWPTVIGNANAVHVASYVGGAELQVLYGGTIIDGTRITTGSIGAAQITTGQLLSSSAQIGDLIVSRAKIGNLQVDSSKIDFNAVSVPLVQTVPEASIQTSTNSYTAAPVIAEVSVTLDEPGTIVAMAYAKIGYLGSPTFYSQWLAELSIGTSIPVYSRDTGTIDVFGHRVTETRVSIMTATTVSAGTYPVRFKAFRTNDSNPDIAIGPTTLFVQGFKR